MKRHSSSAENDQAFMSRTGWESDCPLGVKEHGEATCSHSRVILFHHCNVCPHAQQNLQSGASGILLDYFTFE